MTVWEMSGGPVDARKHFEMSIDGLGLLPVE